jgi:hypothetical protein
MTLDHVAVGCPVFPELHGLIVAFLVCPVVEEFGGDAVVGRRRNPSVLHPPECCLSPEFVDRTRGVNNREM